jgi:hypothetical protein
MMRKRERERVGRRPQNQHRPTTQETRQTKTEEQKKSPSRETRRRREHGPGPHTLAPPVFFLLNLVSWLNVFFEMAKNICVFFGFF